MYILYRDSVTGCTIRSSNSGKGKIFPLLKKRPDKFWVPPSLLFNGFFHGGNAVGPRLRMKGAIPLFP